MPSSRPELAPAAGLGLALALCTLAVGCPRPLAPRVDEVALACEQRAVAPRPLRVSLLVAGGVDEARAAHVLGAARAYWQTQGVDLVFATRARTPLRAVVADAAGAPRTARAALASLLRPAFDLVRERAQTAGATDVDVVLLERLSAPGSAADRFFERLDGFTLSPLHREALRGDAEADRIYDALGAESFRPTVFLAVPKQRDLPPGQADLRLAHELGHVFGLDHRGGARDLMSLQRGAKCPALNDEERAAVGRALTELDARR